MQVNAFGSDRLIGDDDTTCYRCARLLINQGSARHLDELSVFPKALTWRVATEALLKSEEKSATICCTAGLSGAPGTTDMRMRTSPVSSPPSWTQRSCAWEKQIMRMHGS
jgi:hypothetical protein